MSISVIPAKAGISCRVSALLHETPAFAGVTVPRETPAVAGATV